MKYRIIRVYENDCDYNYEQLFLVKCNNKEKEKLEKLQRELKSLDWEERIEKYGDNANSKICFIENYIMENMEVLETNLIEINCY